ncbi:hypothetical protein LG943_16610 [Streptomonospora sp. S1-112]|uniref:Uncharacterized protein n=1 Tax=Streptomonospora mangrovi TaxID=2883123 RepID=A0A9X3NM47_9ACTN|nr:hypothetical protein [Streptomonospora mangrovi]MDA0565922.1 hypothetical protein [Streptomonospora mangrovi]
MKRRGRLKGALGSHDRPASPLAFRLVLAVFGAGVLVVGTVLSVLLGGPPPLTIVLAAGTVASGFNVYWVWQRWRHE